MASRFEGRSVIVTGAGYGIGRGIALRFAKEGAKIAIVDIDKPNVEETAKLISQASGESMILSSDVSNSEAVAKAVKSVKDNFGRVDVLVNNAGIRSIHRTIETSDEEWNRTVSVNLSGTFFMTRSVAPLMIKQGKGKIINVASISGFLGQNGRSVYGATKAGIMQLTRAFAVELGSSINVNAVAPGYIAGTGMMAEVDKNTKVVEWNIANTPLRRAGTPEDIAAAVAFLASDDASFITGTTLVVDGGFSSSKYLVDAGM